MSFDTDHVIPAAERALARLWGHPVTLQPGPHRRGNAGVFHAGERAVFLKRPPARGAEAYDPDDLADHSAASRLRNERDALTLLAAAPVPTLLAADLRAGFALMEVVEGVALDAILLGDDPDLAARVLLAAARALAETHAAGRGGTLRARGTAWVRQGIARLNPSGDAQAQAERAAALIQTPGPFTTVVHGDPCPDNLMWTGARVVVLDFEHAAMGHGLLDAVYVRMGQPTCWCAHTAPDLADAFEQTYRDHAGWSVSDTVWAEHRAAACVAHVASNVHHLLDKVTGEDRVWGQATVRDRLVARARLAQPPLRDAGWDALADALERVASDWHSAWEVSGLQPFPALCA